MASPTITPDGALQANNSPAPSVNSYTPLPASGLTPAVPTTAPTGQTSTAAPAASPTAIVSSQAAATQVNQKIVPAMQQGKTDVATQNATRAAQAATPPAAAPAAPPAPAPTPEQTIANTPDTGNQFLYDAQGNRIQNPLNAPVPPGYATTNPTVAPTTPVADTATDSVGNTYKQYSDGTYGKFDPTGAYQGVASAQDFQTTKTGQGLLNSLQQAINGTYPLTPSQQAQIDGMKAQFQDLIEQQKTANANFTGGTTVAENLYGMGNSITGLGEIKGTVDQGLAKIADLNSKMNASVAQMEASFQNDDLTALKTAYDIYTTSVKDRQDELDKLTAAATAAAKDTRDYNLKLTEDKQAQAHQALQDALDNSKFTYQQKQDAIDNAFKQQQITETQRHNLATEAASSSVNDLISNPTSVQMTATGNPDATSQAAFLAQLPGGATGQTAMNVKGLANYSIPLTSFPTNVRKGTSGLNQQQMEALAQQYDPTFDAKQYATRAAMQKNVTSGQYSQTITAANTLVQHLSKFNTAISALDKTNGPISGLNYLTNSLYTNIGGAPNEQNFKIEADAIASEAAKIYKGTGAPSEAEISSWKESLSPNASPAQHQAAIQTIIGLMAGKLSTLSQNYSTVMGKPGSFQILTPQSAKVLTDLGIDPQTVDPSYSPTQAAVSSVAPQIQMAISQGYTSDQIVQHLSSDATLGPQIQAALQAGYSSDDVIQYLQSNAQ